MGREHAGPGLALLEAGAAGAPGPPREGADPGLEVLADLLLAAVEVDRVSETYDLLSELVGERPVRAAHEITMQRLADAVGAAAGAAEGAADQAQPDPLAGPPAVGDDARVLLQAIRHTTPAGKGTA